MVATIEKKAESVTVSSLIALLHAKATSALASQSRVVIYLGEENSDLETISGMLFAGKDDRNKLIEPIYVKIKDREYEAFFVNTDNTLERINDFMFFGDYALSEVGVIIKRNDNASGTLYLLTKSRETDDEVPYKIAYGDFTKLKRLEHAEDIKNEFKKLIRNNSEASAYTKMIQYVNKRYFDLKGNMGQIAIIYLGYDRKTIETVFSDLNGGNEIRKSSVDRVPLLLDIGKQYTSTKSFSSGYPIYGDVDKSWYNVIGNFKTLELEPADYINITIQSKTGLPEA
ncbi:MAG: hypothetical protein ACP5T3_00875, partial [Candidatus Micrarchaeia archaeon]